MMQPEEPEKPKQAKSFRTETAMLADAVRRSFLDPLDRRATAIFIQKDEWKTLGSAHSLIVGELMLECLDRFLEKQAGRAVLTVRFTDEGKQAEPRYTMREIDGQHRQILFEGTQFLELKDSRIVVQAEPLDIGPLGERHQLLRVSGSRDTGQFLRSWGVFCRENNYLRERAFFPSGKLIERDRPYTWDDVVLSATQRRTLRIHVEDFLRSSESLQARGVKSRRGIILAGPPGTGKTMVGKVLADTAGVSFLWVRPNDLTETTGFSGILELARFVAPAIIFLEDLDLFAGDRAGGTGSQLGELMNELDGAIDNERIVTIATTNHLEAVEKALRNRPGRFDRTVHMDTLDADCRRALLTKLLGHTTSEDGLMDMLVTATNGYTGAQIEELVNTIYILAEARENDRGGGARSAILNRDLIQAATDDLGTNTKGGFGFKAKRDG